MFDDHDAVRLIVNDIWSEMFDLTAVPVSACTPSGNDTDAVRASVVLSGEWSAEVLLRCSPELARTVARRMFAIAAEDTVDQSLVDDALGEVVNMIAGNTKVLFPATSNLSLPQFPFDDGGVTGGEVVVETAFECKGETFEVKVLSAAGAGLAA